MKRTFTTKRARRRGRMGGISPAARAAVVLMGLVAVSILLIHRETRASGPANTWYKTDTHVHSTTSASAYEDLGLVAQQATTLGYNAIFLTDHAAGSTWPLGLNNTAYHVAFDDALNGYWTTTRYGFTTATSGAPDGFARVFGYQFVAYSCQFYHLWRVDSVGQPRGQLPLRETSSCTSPSTQPALTRGRASMYPSPSVATPQYAPPPTGTLPKQASLLPARAQYSSGSWEQPGQPRPIPTRGSSPILYPSP